MSSSCGLESNIAHKLPVKPPKLPVSTPKTSKVVKKTVKTSKMRSVKQKYTQLNPPKSKSKAATQVKKNCKKIIADSKNISDPEENEKRKVAAEVEKICKKITSDSENISEPSTSAASEVQYHKKRVTKSKAEEIEKRKVAAEVEKICKKITSDSENISEPSTSAASEVQYPKKRVTRSKAEFKHTPKVSKVKNIRKRKVTIVTSKKESTAKTAPKGTRARSSEKKPKIPKATLKRSVSSSPEPGPSNDQMKRRKRKSKNEVTVTPKDFEYSLRAYKHSPGYMDLKKKRFNTGFRYETPRGERDIEIFSPEEESSGRYFDNIPDIPNRMQVTVPGEKYANIFKNMPIDTYDKSIDLEEEEKLYAQLPKARRGRQTHKNDSSSTSASKNKGKKKQNTNSCDRKIEQKVGKKGKSTVPDQIMRLFPDYDSDSPAISDDEEYRERIHRNRRRCVVSADPCPVSDCPLPENPEQKPRKPLFFQLLEMATLEMEEEAGIKVNSSNDISPQIVTEPDQSPKLLTKSEAEVEDEPMQTAEFGNRMSLLPDVKPTDDSVLRVTVPHVPFDTPTNVKREVLE